IPVEVTSVNDNPIDFNIIAPLVDSTIVINKSNYLNIFYISWETSADIEDDPIFYDLIFNGDLAKLSRYGLNSTSAEYVLKEILSVTDTVSIAHSTFSIIATDGELETSAINSDISLIVDGRLFAPAKLHLDQNYPNPFNHKTIIGFDLPKRTNVSIIIYDLLGEEVIILIDNKKHDRGYNTIAWNGIDKHNNIVTAGIYIVQIRMGSEIKNKKLVFLK
ncbi:MAG: T9SS type A sorting domain-containing protein, partial [Candidatus Marinimicrobia bacterium]|nr:T9SS type A sorting domain-containing protein [Candidatus Neomarinimicrobiota bacterium]